MTIETIKKEYQYLDLYGSELFIKMLKMSFNSVCFCNKSIPAGGSPVRKSEQVREDLTVTKAIFHRNNEITILTNNGNLRFF